ncbi:hypothetical protein [Neobacillus drentensis]|uniref:hypothetical protein n=1 Tax=Neobacillus drentensis TaxID=220684 RepID=UPI002FFFB58B
MGYYEVYQSSGLKGEQLFSMYTTKNEEKIRQVAGIIEWSCKNQQFSQIDQLIKKGYEFVYQYLRQHKQIDFDHFMKSYAKRHKSKVIKEIELIYQNIILWYLCERENIHFDTGSVAWQSFQEVLCTSLNEIEIQIVMFSEIMLVKHKKEIENFYIEYNIPRNANFDSLGAFFEYLICD